MTVSKSDLKKIRELVNEWKFPFPDTSDVYASLEDENDPDGVVNLYTKDGHVIMSMPRDVYDAIMNYKENNHEL